MSENMNEPWSVNERTGMLIDCNGKNVIGSPEVQRHITACVNACSGVSTAGIEVIAALGGIQSKMPVASGLVLQRDQLLDALKGLLNALPSATTHPAIKAARAAITAAEPQQ